LKLKGDDPSGALIAVGLTAALFLPDANLAIADVMLEHGFWPSEGLPGLYFNLDKSSSGRPDAPKGVLSFYQMPERVPDPNSADERTLPLYEAENR
jgi:hypothetical protein